MSELYIFLPLVTRVNTSQPTDVNSDCLHVQTSPTNITEVDRLSTLVIK